MLDEIRTFVVLAETGSLQRAAERLFLTPSAVTRQIQRLEGVLKTPLLDRRVKPGRITREGRAVGRCGPAFEDCDALRDVEVLALFRMMSDCRF
jgi:DNA-binding transcriptional LysR family regulator